MKNMSIFRNGIRNTLFLLPILVGMMVTTYSYLLMPKYEEDTFGVLIATIGSLNINTIFLIIPVFAYSLPFLSFIMITGDLIYKDYVDMGMLILPRLQKKKRWFFNSVKELSIFSGLFLLLIFFSSTLMNIYFGYQFKMDSVYEIITLFLLMFFFFLTSSMISNLICFATRSGLGYVFVITFYFLSIFLSGFLYEWAPSYLKIIPWLPTTHSLLTWHSGYETSFLNFPLWFSFIYLLVGFTIVSIVLYTIMQRYENL